MNIAKGGCAVVAYFQVWVAVHEEDVIANGDDSENALREAIKSINIATTYWC